MPLRSLLVDDNARFIAAARELLEREGIEVVGVASTIDDAARLAGALRPDVCLVDIDLGDESGFELARRLTEPANHTPRVVLISAYPERDFADMIADSPAIGFLPKPEISAARIHAMLAGEPGGE
jgi:DNA-binding NarL/FixJ family response regulator